VVMAEDTVDARAQLLDLLEMAHSMELDGPPEQPPHPPGKKLPVVS
jgi:hypothetical protein